MDTTAEVARGPAEQTERPATEPLAAAEDSRLAAEWHAAGERAVTRPARITVPYRGGTYRERVYFDPAMPMAVGYHISATRGRRYPIWLQPAGAWDQHPRLVVSVLDLNVDSNRPPELVLQELIGVGSVLFEPLRDAEHLIRVQPLPLFGGTVEITIGVEAAFRFPVLGRDRWSVISVFGQTREAGRRSHEGIDIAGPDGTPVVAVTNGVIYSTGGSPRGGNTITLYDHARDLLLYYAHLQEILVEQGQRVDEGDVIGTLGHSGNASAALPHLHFGIYDHGWSYPINPWAFLVAPNGSDVRETVIEPQAPSPLSPARSPVSYGAWVRTSGYVGTVESAPGVRAQIAGYDNGTLAAHTALRVVGSTANQLRLLRPDSHRVVYLSPAQVEPLGERVGTALLKNPVDTYDHPPVDRGPETVTPTAVGVVQPGSYPILARYHRYRLIRVEETLKWIAAPR